MDNDNDSPSCMLYLEISMKSMILTNSGLIANEEWWNIFQII